MQKYNFILILLSTSLSMSACQPKAEIADTPAVQVTKQPTIKLPVKMTTPSESKVSNDKTVMAKDCIALSQTMQKVDSDSKIEAIYGIQDQLKACLPTANNAEVVTLLKSYQAMYDRFLASDLDSELNLETFNGAIYELYYGEGLSSAQLKTLTPRDQYLVGLVKGDTDVSIYDEGEGYFSFTHNLKAMADIFTPYLRKDQRLFIERMAIDNQESFWSDASVTVSFADLIERAVFWEDYIQQYPDGYAVEDAKILLNLYQHTLFFGSDNTDWTDNDFRTFTDPQYKTMMLQLAKRPKGALGRNARILLDFMTLTENERQQKYLKSLTNTERNLLEEEFSSYDSLEKMLKVHRPWDVRHYRDCLNGLFCEDDIDFASLDVLPSFAEICPSAQSEPMQIQKDLKVWGFEAEFANKNLQCEPLNLKDYESFDCRFGLDWRQEPYISISNDRGWYKDFYDTSERCALALEGHLAADNEKS